MTDKLIMPKPTHDALFRKAMENPAARKDFFDNCLPSYIKAIVDTNALALEKDSFIDQSLRSSISDLLFRVESDDKNVYIYLLLEHQSKPHPFMAFRLFKYMLNICDRHLQQNTESKALPLIYPMVFYNGRQKYNVSRNLWDLFGNNELAKKFWTEDHQIINVREIPDEELKGPSAGQILSFFMKHIHERELLQKWEEIAPFLREIKINAGLDYIELFLHYTLTFIGDTDTMRLKDVLLDNLTEVDGEEIMLSYGEKLARKLAKEFRQEGRQEGEKEGLVLGMKKAALNFLKNGVDINIVSKSTGLTIEDILSLSANDKELA